MLATLQRSILALAAVALMLSSSRAADDAKETILFNGKDLSGWKTRDAKAKEAWKLAGVVGMDQKDNKKLVGDPAAAVGGPETAMILEKPVHGADIVSEATFGDCEVHVEFMVPKGSNSGVYLMGQYEIQVLDSYGKKDDQLKPGDLGGIYTTKAPSKNASKKPGEWQSFDIVFRAPRFKDGKKVENARFISVKLNGETIHENIEAPKPTGSELPGGEKPVGPLMFQGDHGPVAYRNVKVKAVEAK